ncbi:tRNA (N6-threonylcarbamoyladenosine(37)-N6)-methyltransferase TrmO [Halanaeroarchaeum sulfurireducens]|uniref:TsaA-like domain-containing protein n=1 Tax=Halanaeroarchaeum sulfurireducens TaxID=1604004 RepID=A0A0F7P950_9EURY|nr:tRNA (N6-threonylcarbamoyladenosine(37)-N6)-methyltransferase TrmO [Halanaeroarchaeum sulfurireducens]AKH97282.1 hypothetical protein HLASF_0787 [Halanaeroarchaeum sulfurireducens]ALG81684.1 hypothetical protein HLASA_0784 [Halanaeroarchaeum sulfurireducens]
MSRVVYEPIGYVESPFVDPAAVPRPASDQVEASGAVVIEDEYEAGLEGLADFSHVVLVSHLHETEGHRLQVHPKGNDLEVGIFATSGPLRPNPIGLSVVALESIDGTRLSVANLDLVDDTPILDVKPFAPKVDVSTLDIGWMDESLTDS